MIKKKKKIFTFRLENIDLKKEFINAIRTGQGRVEPDVMYCADTETIIKVTSASCLKVFSAIIQYEPGSLYELSRLTHLDKSNLSREVAALEEMGLIKIEIRTVNSRNLKKPIALYDQINIEFNVHVPKKPYKIAI